MGQMMEKHGRLEIDEHYEHHVRGWRLKRISWTVMAALILIALCGLLGPGPFSNTSAQGPGELRAKYERIARYHAPAYLELTVPGGKDDLEISVPAALIKQIELERIDPEPKEMRLNGEKHTWIFSREQASSEVIIHYRPQAFGRKHFRLEVKGAGSLDLQQFVVP
jgi:hypothetical protein